MARFVRDRRNFIVGSSAALALRPLSGCSHLYNSDYDRAVAQLRAVLKTHPESKNMLRFATLAANGHNTQPWCFGLRESGVSIGPDFSRPTPAVDPDDHRLFVSLVCARGRWRRPDRH